MYLHAYICNIYFLQYHVMFKPVIDELWELDAIQKFNKNSICPVPSPKTPHMIQTLAHCWCDADANASFSQGKLNPSYVVEIYIHPWDPLDARNRKLFKVFHINDIMHKKESAPDCFKKARVNFCLRSHI